MKQSHHFGRGVIQESVVSFVTSKYTKNILDSHRSRKIICLA